MATQAERRSATRKTILAASRDLFAAQGFGTVSLDDVARRAGVTKGAIYHHFESKIVLFDHVVVAEQARLAERISPNAGGDVVALFIDAARNYFTEVSAPGTRQILLIDGPSVLGWARWREIDERTFGRTVRQAIALICDGKKTGGEMEALSSLLMGALLEGAMVCALSSDPGRSTHEMSAAFRPLLEGIQAS